MGAMGESFQIQAMMPSKEMVQMTALVILLLPTGFLRGKALSVPLEHGQQHSPFRETSVI